MENDLATVMGKPTNLFFMGQTIYPHTPNFKSEIWIDWENKGELITSIDDSGIEHYLQFLIILYFKILACPVAFHSLH